MIYEPNSICTGKVSSFEEEDGTGTGKNEVRIKLSRGDLGSQFTCQAENEAIDQPLSTSVQVDVNRKSTLEHWDRIVFESRFS